MKILVENFRRFHGPDEIDIAPITILVGENSSGKSSFLAGLRYMIEAMSFPAEGSFNREPFFLGAYDQIAHFRGGQYGRSSSFKLGLSLSGEELTAMHARRRVLGRGTTSLPVSMKLEFVNESSQPVISRLALSNNRVELEFRRRDENNYILRNLSDGQEIDLSDRSQEKNSVKVHLWSDSPSRQNNLSLHFQIAATLSFHLGSRIDKAKNTSFPQSQHELLRELVPYLEQSPFTGPLFLPDAVYASAPFRTRPERTYSPIEASSSAEGTHIPILMAQSKAFDSKRWAQIKSALEDFGAKSGMFKRIDVKQLGRSQSDPFQIIVTVSKDRSNLIDVGYGVSQILPLIVETIVNRDSFMFLFQQPEVHLHPRGQAELGSYFVEFSQKNKGTYLVIETHSDFVIDRIRQEIISRKLSPENHLALLFFERRALETKIHKINIDSKGSVISPPDSYREFFLEETIKNLGVQ